MLEISARADKGPKVSDETFNLDHVYLILKRLVEKYDVRYDPAAPVSADDALADRVYVAALEFFTDCGVYVQNTHSEDL